jgi:ATP-binding cassette subfamily F protein uup
MPSPVLVSLDGVSKAHGITPILENLSIGVAEGDRIGIVGRNGAGKTTLVDILTGRQAADEGRVTSVGDLRAGVLRQTDELDDDAVVTDIVIGPDTPEHVWRGDAVIRGVVGSLGLEPLLDRRVGTLSGGERRRVALAELLVADHDLLVLDEPTNHLDVEGVAWLAAHLTSPTARHRALMVVTHDRWFLDEVVAVTWEVADGAVHTYDGGYSAYVLARAERRRQADASDARRRNLLRKELAWLRRGAPARTSKPRYRVEAANALIEDVPAPRDSSSLQRFSAARLGKSVYDLENASLRLGGRELLRDVTWRPGPGERIALIGVNGAGKTTLLRILAGQQELDSGHLRTGVTVVPAYLTQDVRELSNDRRVLEAVQDVAGTLKLAGEELSASQLLERFGFTGDRQWTLVRDLSGGERRRLQLLRLLMTGPNVLILDEPTNDLDVDTLISLEDLLDHWAGTLIVVSHDRWFLERVCDTTMALLGDGSLAALPGGVTEYLQRRAAKAPGGSGPSGRARQGDSRAERKELQRVERELKKLGQAETKVHERLVGAAADHVQAAELQAELRAMAIERTALEETWLELAERDSS